MVAGEGTTYDGAFSMQFSELPQFSIHSKAKHHFTPGRIETTASMSYGENDFDISMNEVITYSADQDSRKYDLRMEVASQSHRLDVLLTDKIIMSRNYFLRDGYVRLTPDQEITSKVELGYHQGKEGYIRLKIAAAQIDISQEIAITKIADSHFTAKVTIIKNIDYNERSIYIKELG